MRTMEKLFVLAVSLICDVLIILTEEEAKAAGFTLDTIYKPKKALKMLDKAGVLGYRYKVVKDSHWGQVCFRLETDKEVKERLGKPKDIMEVAIQRASALAAGRAKRKAGGLPEYMDGIFVGGRVMAADKAKRWEELSLHGEKGRNKIHRKKRKKKVVKIKKALTAISRVQQGEGRLSDLDKFFPKGSLPEA